MMQDEDLVGPARKNVFQQAVTRFSQVCNVSILNKLMLQI